MKSNTQDVNNKQKCSQCKKYFKLSDFVRLSTNNEMKTFKTCCRCKVHQTKAKMKSKNYKTNDISKLLDEIFAKKDENIAEHLVETYNGIKKQQQSLLIQVCKDIYVK